MLYQIKQRVLALAAHHDVDEIGLQGLLWQKRRMPATQDYGKIRIPRFDGSRNLRSLTNHGARHKGNGQADGVFYLVENALFVVRRDRRINNLDRVTRAQKWSGHSQYPEGSRCFRACKRRKEENNLF